MAIVMGASQPIVSLNEVHTLPRLIIHSRW